MSDERYEEAELRDARALADALDQGGAGAADSRTLDALDAAELIALLKASVLDDARSESILAEAERLIAGSKRRIHNRRVFMGASAVLAVAAAALLMLRVQEAPSRTVDMQAEAPTSMAPRAPESAAMPLIAAQLAWVNAPSAATSGAVERELRAYRRAHLATLARRYAP